MYLCGAFEYSLEKVGIGPQEVERVTELCVDVPRMTEQSRKG